MSYSDDGGEFGRSQIAFIWAVLVPAFVTAVVTASLLGSGGDASFGAEVFVASFITASIVIGIAAGLIGLPLTWLLARYGLERPWIYPAAGFVAGGAIVLLLLLLSGETRGAGITEFLPFAVVGALPGCLCGQAWWWFNRRHKQPVPIIAERYDRQRP